MRVTFRNTEVEMLINASRPELAALRDVLRRGVSKASLSEGQLVSDEERTAASETAARIDDLLRDSDTTGWGDRNRIPYDKFQEIELGSEWGRA